MTACRSGIGRCDMIPAQCSTHDVYDCVSARPTVGETLSLLPTSPAAAGVRYRELESELVSVVSPWMPRCVRANAARTCATGSQRTAAQRHADFHHPDSNVNCYDLVYHISFRLLKQVRFTKPADGFDQLAASVCDIL